jgi:hypothetical protein
MLTDQLIMSLVARTSPIKRSDGGGLHIVAMPNGKKRWRLAYRFDNKQKTVDGGEYPGTSLHRARVWAEEMKELVANGVDPIVHKKEAKFQIAANQTTFATLERFRPL